MNIYTVYVLKSRKNGRLYIGYTKALSRRLGEHNSGRCSSTKNLLPWDVVYSEQYSSHSQAVLRERYFKTGAGRRWLKKVLM